MTFFNEITELKTSQPICKSVCLSTPFSGTAPTPTSSVSVLSAHLCLCGSSYLSSGHIPSASSRELTSSPCTVPVSSLTDLLCLSLTLSNNRLSLFFIFWFLPPSSLSYLCFILVVCLSPHTCCGDVMYVVPTNEFMWMRNSQSNMKEQRWDNDYYKWQFISSYLQAWM